MEYFLKYHSVSYMRNVLYYLTSYILKRKEYFETIFITNEDICFLDCIYNIISTINNLFKRQICFYYVDFDRYSPKDVFNHIFILFFRIDRYIFLIGCFKLLSRDQYFKIIFHKYKELCFYDKFYNIISNMTICFRRNICIYFSDFDLYYFEENNY